MGTCAVSGTELARGVTWGHGCSSALLNAGYSYSHSHTCPTAFKTDAPPQVLPETLDPRP
eukprot:702331-Rhodomonas_salina.1